MASMSMRALLVAALVAAVAGCGGDAQREVRLLAPVGIVADAQAARFERQTGCRVDLRVYDPDEDIKAIAGRRDTDVIAHPTPDGETPDISERSRAPRSPEGWSSPCPAGWPPRSTRS